MKKRFLITTTIICFVFSIPLFALAETTKPIKIGVVNPISGGAAMILSKGYLAGYKMAVEEINKAGGLLGRQIELIVRDDAGNPELTTRYCRELIVKDEVDFLFAGVGTITMKAAQAVAEQLKKPVLMWGHPDSITIEDWSPYGFRISITDTTEALMSVRILKEEVLKGVKNPTIYWISWEYEYGHNIYKPFMRMIKEQIPDAKVVGEAWPRVGETDYGPFINQILASKPTVIVSLIWGGGIASLLKQSQQYDVFQRSKLICTGLIGSIEYRTAIGMDMPEGTWCNTYDDVIYPNNEKQRKFYQMYRDFTGEKVAPVPSHASLAYYVFHLAAGAIKKARTTEAQAVAKTLEGMTIDTYWGPLKVRDFDHQLLVGNIWAPTVKKAEVPYLLLDATRARYVYIEGDLPTKEEWLARRRAAGKIK